MDQVFILMVTDKALSIQMQRKICYSWLVHIDILWLEPFHNTSSYSCSPNGKTYDLSVDKINNPKQLKKKWSSRTSTMKHQFKTGH